MKPKEYKESLYFNVVALIVSFILALGILITQSQTKYFPNWTLFTSWIVLFSLGGLLIFVTYKSKIKGKIRKVLLLTGYSSAGIIACIVLHNLLYALNTVTKDILILGWIVTALEVIFFFGAVLVFPITFMLGMILTVIYYYKNRSTKKKRGTRKPRKKSKHKKKS